MRIRVLGQFAALADDEPLDIGHPKQRAVLAMLAVRANQPVTTDEMVEGLWGDAPPPTATATLQAYVSNLRRVLEPGRERRSPSSVIRTVGGGYQLVVAPDAIDANRFDRLVDEAAGDDDPERSGALLREALGLWTGPALADFRYEQFAQAEIARLEERHVHALELRIAADLELGRAGELVPELVGLTADHPYRERLHGQLMIALYRAGRHAEALAAYDRLTAALRDQLGLDPGPELRDLQLAILEHDTRLLMSTRPRGGSARALLRRSAPRREPRPLIGREQELETCRAALADAAEGCGSILVVEGPAGIGKTRFLETFHEEARAVGHPGAFARCVEVGGSPPFWPWMQIVRQLGERSVLDAAGALAPMLAPLLSAPDGAEPLFPGPPLHRVADALTAALDALGTPEPVILALDDLYSADPDSLALLTLVAAAIDRLPVVVAVSHRGADLGPEHPLSGVLANFARFRGVQRMPLAPLRRDEVRAIVREIAGGEIEESVVDEIHHRTDGNAFFTVELSRWVAAGGDELGSRDVPSTVREVVLRRTADLSADARSLVRAGAICGREFELATALDVTGLDVDDGSDALEEIVRLGLLTDGERPGAVRFSHVIVVDSLLQSLSVLRRAQLHHRAAESLERRYGSDPRAWVDIAHHRCEAIGIGSVEEAIEALARAGGHAIDVDALGLAESLARRRRVLIDLLPAGDLRDAAELAALLELIRVWTWSEGYHSPHIGVVADRLAELTGLAAGTATFDTTRPITSDDPILCSLQARFSYEMVGHTVTAAQQVVEQWTELAAITPDPMVVLSANLAKMIAAVHAGSVDDGVAAVVEARAAFEVLDPLATNGIMLPLGQQSARVTMHAFAGWALYLAGRQEDAEAELAAARAWSERLGHAFTTGFCVSVEGLVAAMNGSPDWVDDVLAWGRPVVDERLYGLLDLWHGLLATWAAGRRGDDPGGAADRLRSDLEMLERRGAKVVMSLYWAMTAELELTAQRPDRALDAAGRGLAHAAESGERFWTPELQRLAATAHAALDDQAACDSALADAARLAGELGIVPLQARCATPSAG